MTNINAEVVHVFPKNDREYVYAYIQEYRGRNLAHLRHFWTDEHDVDHPTKSGVAIGVEDLPQLLEAVTALCATAEELKSA